MINRRSFLSAIIVMPIIFLGERQSHAIGDVRQELANVRAYFRGRGPGALAQAQAVLAAYGSYRATVDGVWGPRTERAFIAALQEFMRMQPAHGMGVDKPADTPAFLNWIAELVSYRTTGEYPD